MLDYAHVVRDAVHGDIALTSEELGVLDTAEMQRLRNVRQLGVAYLVYPGAQHSRFEHSIGTAHLVRRMAEEINGVRDREGGGGLGGYDRHELRILRLAALVHDSTHLPFGHNIEDQTGLLPRHDTAERFCSVLGEQTGLGRRLAATGVREEVLAILAPEAAAPGQQVPQHWRDLVSGTVDADLLDYLARDALFTGLHLGYDPRIFNMFRVDRRSQQLYVDLGRRGYLKEALLSEILRCLEARYYFSERVYYHHAKIAAGALVAKAVEIALLDGALAFDALQRATDAGLLDMLAGAQIRDPEQAERLRTFVEALQRRQLPKRAAIFPVYANEGHQDRWIEQFFGAGSADKRRQVESELSAELEAETGARVPVLLYCPAARMQLKQAKLLVHWPGESQLAPLSSFHDQVPRLADLEQAYRRMWKFYVLALTPEAKVLQTLGRLAVERFPGAVNVLGHNRSFG